MKLAAEGRTKQEEELDWKPSLDFEEGLTRTVKWYLENQEWMRGITSGAYQYYYESQYGDR